mmetsp:Transcript_41567/g.96364  ORF Transcript_41567/g.96364 Transcript_41567/m.96364 type:complete len:149 (-) Transcript_41567:95-541(-)
MQRPLAYAQFCSKLLGGLLGSLLIDRLGRKRVLTPCFLLTAIGTWAFVNAATVPGLFTATVLLYASNEILWSTLTTFSCEAFPTDVRTSALGLCVAAGRLSASVSVAIGPPLMAVGPRVPFLLNAAVLVLGGALCLLLPAETSGKSLR